MLFYEQIQANVIIKKELPAEEVDWFLSHLFYSFEVFPDDDHPLPHAPHAIQTYFLHLHLSKTPSSASSLAISSWATSSSQVWSPFSSLLSLLLFCSFPWLLSSPSLGTKTHSSPKSCSIITLFFSCKTLYQTQDFRRYCPLHRWNATSWWYDHRIYAGTAQQQQTPISWPRDHRNPVLIRSLWLTLWRSSHCTPSIASYKLCQYISYKQPKQHQ